MVVAEHEKVLVSVAATFEIADILLRQICTFFASN
jgi:hypothetical protein